LKELYKAIIGEFDYTSDDRKIICRFKCNNCGDAHEVNVNNRIIKCEKDPTKKYCRLCLEDHHPLNICRSERR
jgi:hypothetical protein